jgi:AraC-like DNA-binding protein
LRDTSGLERRRPDTLLAHRQAVVRAVGMMKERLCEEISLQDVADAAYVSPYHFSRLFRGLAGIPPGQFLSALRIQRAKRLLLVTDLDVTDVCFEVGFNSLGTFSRRFKELTGVSPRQLRSLASRDSPMVVPERVPRPAASPSVVEGELEVPAGFSGPVFIGLFPTPIPQGRPTACTIARSATRFRIQHAPADRQYLFAAAFPSDTRLTEQVVCDGSLLAARIDRPLRVRQGKVSRVERLKLQPPDVVDPPMLLTFPLLVSEHRSADGHPTGARGS